MTTKTENHPKYPIYVISKNRADYRYTQRALERLGVSYNLVVESEQYDDYAKNNPGVNILTLPFNNHGKGSGPARNWVWEHSLSEGHDRHWILDDNIRAFYRLHENKRSYMYSGAGFKVIEDFTDRFTNVGLSAMQYSFFAVEGQAATRDPVKANRRVMSCILVNNHLPLRWRGKYNEDVDISIRCLKEGWCTLLFYAFLCGKLETQAIKGGNTEELYGQGTLEKSKMLVNMHPDIVKLVWRYGRWHHHADFTKFEGNPVLQPKPDLNLKKGQINNYGLVRRKDTSYPNDELLGVTNAKHR